VAVNRACSFATPVINPIAIIFSAHFLVLLRRLLDLSSDLSTWRYLTFQNSLVITGGVIFFEPIDECNKITMIRLVEVITARTHLDELFDNFFTGNICQDDVLRIAGQNSKAIRDSTFISILFIA